MTVRAVGSLVALLAVTSLAGSARAAVPAENGPIVVESYGLRTIDPRTGFATLVRAEETPEGNDAFAEVEASPDGRRLATVYRPRDDDDGYGVIAVVDIDGGRLSPTTTKGTDPDWTPDGRLLLTTPPGTAPQKVVVMSADGSGVRTLVDLAENAFAPVASPDGRWVYFARSPPSGQSTGTNIHRVPADGGAPVAVTSLPSGQEARTFDVSPDGATLLYQRRAFPRSDLVARTLSTGAERILATTSGQNGIFDHADFSPDGREVVYLQRRDAVVDELRRVGADGTGDRLFETNVPRTEQDGAAHSFSGVAWAPSTAKPSLEVSLDGFASGPDEVTLTSTLRNVSRDGAVTGLTFPGGGLTLDASPYPPLAQGELRVRAGPGPALPSLLGAAAESLHGYVLDVRWPGVVQVRVQADGRSPYRTDVSSGDYVEVAATPLRPDREQQRALFASAYVRMCEQMQAETAAAIADSIGLVEKSLAKLDGSVRKDLRRDTASEDLLADAFGVPAGSLDFLPDKMRSYLLWSQARSQGEWKAWQRRFNSTAGSTRQTLTWWSGQLRGASRATLFKAGEALYDAASEQATGLASFSRDAYGLVSTKAAGEILDGLPIVLGEHRDAVKGKVRAAWTLTKGRASQIARQFRRSDEKGIKASAEWFAEGEVAVAAVVAETALVDGATRGLATMARMRKASAGATAVEAAQDALGADGTLADLLPRTITDGLAPPSAAQLGMTAVDQGLIGGVLSDLSKKAARLGYPGLELEAAFRSRGYSAPGAIGKNQYIKGKTGAAIDLLLGMDRAGLGNQAIYKPKLPAFFKNLPADIRAAVKTRFDDQNGVHKQWTLAVAGKTSKLTDLFRATLKKGGTFTNTVAGQAADTTYMKLSRRKVGNGTTILEYVDLVVNGTKIVNGKRTPIGSDFDGLYLALKGGSKLPAGVAGSLWLEANQLFAALARDKGFAWGFHGFSRDSFDFGEKLFEKLIWQYIAEGLPEADALRLFGAKGDDILKKMTFGQYAVKVTAAGATTGPLAP